MREKKGAVLALSSLLLLVIVIGAAVYFIPRLTGKSGAIGGQLAAVGDQAKPSGTVNLPDCIGIEDTTITLTAQDKYVSTNKISLTPQKRCGCWELY